MPSESWNDPQYLNLLEAIKATQVRDLSGEPTKDYLSLFLDCDPRVLLEVCGGDSDVVRAAYVVSARGKKPALKKTFITPIASDRDLLERRWRVGADITNLHENNPTHPSAEDKEKILAYASDLFLNLVRVPDGLPEAELRHVSDQEVDISSALQLLLDEGWVTHPADSTRIVAKPALREIFDVHNGMQPLGEFEPLLDDEQRAHLDLNRSEEENSRQILFDRLAQIR